MVHLLFSRLRWYPRRFATLVIGCALCVLGMLVALGAGLAGSACSLLVNQGASQCAVDADCARFAGTRCQQGACVAPLGGFDAAIDPNSPCTSTQDCFTLHGSSWVCRATRCLSLGSVDCGIVIGNYAADNALLLGAILPIYGPHKSTGLPMERSLAFAAEQDFSGGVPFGQDGGSRPVAVVLCDESKNPLRAAEHLAQLGVPAIIGPAFGDSFLAVAGELVTRDHVLLISPYATADLAGLSADAGGLGLAWRTAPSGAGEAAAMAKVAAVLEPRIDAARSRTQLAVSVVWRSDADGTELHTGLLASLSFNGLAATAPANAALFTDISYGNSDTPGVAATAAATKVTGSSPLPGLVVVLGRTEAVNDIIKGIEDGWPPSAPLPYYLVSHGLQVEELLALVAASPTLRARILSTAPGDSAQSNGALRELLVRYRALYADYPAETSGLPQTFDAYYVLAYGLAAVRNADVIGFDERDGLNRILFGGAGSRAVTVGPEGIAAALAAINSGETIALGGTSGALRFDAASGTPPSDVQVSCITQGTGAKGPVFTSANLAWSAATGALTGTLAATCLQ